MRPNLVWRSAAIFVVAGLAHVLLHEGAHAVAALALGAHPVVLYPGAVHPGNITAAQYVVTAMAGPLFSLVLVGIGWQACRRTAGGTDARLAAVWFTFHSFIGSVGYLILTPFSQNDLGGIAWYFDLPEVVRWGMFAAGIWAMTKIATVLLPALSDLAPSRDLLATPDARMRYVAAIAVVPWLIMVAIRVPIDWPLHSVASLGPTLGAGIPLLSGCVDARKRSDLPVGERRWADRMPVGWLVAAAALIALNALVLHPGLTLRG